MISRPKMEDGRWKIDEKGSVVQEAAVSSLPIFNLQTTICRIMMKFEDLEAWRNARQLVRAIYQLTGDKALGHDFGICGQIQRAAVSIMSNIAEGFERSHLQEKLQFYNTARGSTGEVRSLLYVVDDNFPATAQLAAALRNEAVSVGKLISGLIRVTEERKR